MIKALKLPKWYKRQLLATNMVVTRIQGALTNSIYKIEYSDEDESIRLPLLLLRVYGKHVDNLISRESELKILVKLSSKRIGPNLLGIFGNGRFEQFLDGFTTMSKEDVRDPIIAQMVARRMKDMHYQITLDDDERDSDLPVAWMNITKWMTLFETDILPTFPTDLVHETVLMPWENFKLLVNLYRDWLFSKYDRRNIQRNYRLCHNDTQYGNLLLKSTFDPKKVSQSDSDSSDGSGSAGHQRDNNLAVIDFEYSGANFPAYDIADHFSEWMADYHDKERSYYIHDDKYPSKEEQLNFIKFYVNYNFQPNSSTLITKEDPDVNDACASEHEIKKLYNEVIYWRAAVQIQWLVWGLIQHGPFEDSINEIMSTKTEGQGFDGSYEFSTGLDSLSLVRDSNETEAIPSCDDDFDHLKYSQQKACLIMGDMVSFGLANISDIAPQYHNLIKFLDAKVFDI